MSFSSSLKSATKQSFECLAITSQMELETSEDTACFWTLKEIMWLKRELEVVLSVSTSVTLPYWIGYMACHMMIVYSKFGSESQESVP